MSAPDDTARDLAAQDDGATQDPTRRDASTNGSDNDENEHSNSDSEHDGQMIECRNCGETVRVTMEQPNCPKCGLLLISPGHL